MHILLAPIVAWTVAQLIKIIINWWQSKKLNLSLFFASGGMPSSHTAGVVALCCQVALYEGINSTLFGISVIFSSIVFYDAIHVRHSVGEQAVAFNQLLEKIYGQELSDEEKVREVLGHTPLQAWVGFAIGLVCGFLIPAL